MAGARPLTQRKPAVSMIVLVVALATVALLGVYDTVAASQAPATPSSVSTSRADGTLTASWSAIAGATSYHVTYSSTGGASWELAALTHPASGGATESITFDVDNGNTYLVGVRGRGDGGWGGWRNSPPSDPYKPPAPTPTPAPTPEPTPISTPAPKPPARPTGLAAAAGDESVILSWDAAPDVTLVPITGYEYRVNHNDTSTGNLSGWGAWTAVSGSDSTTTSHSLTGLANGAEYRFKIRAVNLGSGSKPAPAAAPWYVSATPRIDPPDPPGGVQATENNGSVTITWTNPNDDSINGYQYQQKQQGGAWGAQTQIGGSGAGTTSHQIGQLPGGTTYQFNLQALNAGGASRGTQVSVHVPATLPGPETVTITSRGTGTLTATWTAVPGAWMYFVSSSNSGDSWKNFTPEDSLTGTSITLNNRNDSLNYTVLVWASTDYGHTLRVESAPAGTSTSPPITPQSVSLSRSGTTLTATWPAVVGAANYNVDLSSDGGSTWVGQATALTTTTWTKSSIDATKSYAVRVQSKNSTGTSGWTESSVSTPAPPAPASVTLGTRTSNTLNVSWSAVSNATSYNVRTSTDSGVTWGSASSETGTTKALTVNGSSDYVVGVQAVNSAGTSGWTVSAISYAIPLPPAPANLAATRGKGSITLTWDAAAGADTYDLACSTFAGNPGMWEVCKTGLTDANRSATITQMYNKTAQRMSVIYDKRDYLFAVRGKNASGNGEWTRLTVWPAVPEQIASITATRTTTTMTLTMTAPPNNGGYTTDRIQVDCRTSSDGGTTWSGWFACSNAETQTPTPGATFNAVVNNLDNYDSALAYQARARAWSALSHAWDWRQSPTFHSIPGVPTINNYVSNILSWSQPSDTGSGSNALTYNVYCRATAAGTWSKAVDGLTVPIGQTSHLTSLLLRPNCTNATSQIAITVSNVYESDRAYWPKPSLAASAVTVTGATLTIANNHSSSWYYKADTGPDSALCQGPVTGTTKTLTGLTAGTTYTYKAYSDSTCAAANLLATASAFTTLEITLTAGSVTTNSATLTLANHSGSWYAKKTAPSGGTCSSAISTTTHNLSSLTAGTWYTYKAYSDSTCTTANEIGAVAFSTAGTVGNLAETNNSTASVGRQFSHSLDTAAQAFTTGSNAGGYTLDSITIAFHQTFGSPGDVVVTLHTADTANSLNPASSARATLTGANPASNTNGTFTCAADPTNTCDLDAGTTYFIRVSAPNATGSGNRYTLKTTSSNNETNTPSGNGWSIVNDGRSGTVLLTTTSWLSLSNVIQMLVTAAPQPGLEAGSVTGTTATLTLVGHVGDWWLKASSGTCVSGESDFSHALSSLTAGTQYTYTAYSDSACTTGKAIGSAAFATPPGVPTSVSVGNSSFTGHIRTYPVSWQKPANTQASDTFAYQLQCTDQGVRTTNIWNSCGTHNITSTANTNMSQTVSHGFAAGLFYYVRVRTVKNGVYSAWVIQKTQYGT